MEKEEMIKVLNEVSESEGYSSWNQVLRDFEISPAKVNGMIFKATQLHITKLEARNKELEEECKWIDINKKHPKNQQICQLFSDGIHLTFFKFHEKGHSGNEFPYFSDMNNKGPIGIDEITHWKPLPKYPDKIAEQALNKE